MNEGGLYNAIFGFNEHAELLKKVLDLDVKNSIYKLNRFRDAWLNEDGTEIVIFLRNGEGAWGRNEVCNVILRTHPNYIRDDLDDGDKTFNYFRFSVPDEFKEEMKSLSTGVPKLGVTERLKGAIKDFEEGKVTVETERMKNVGEKLFKQMKNQKSGILYVGSKDGEGDLRN